jgi:hypothetical protein
MLKRRVPVVLFVVAMLAVATMAPAIADDGTDHVTITMEDGTIHVVDTVFDISVTNGDGFRELGLFLANNGESGFFRVTISGEPGFNLFRQTPGNGGGVCNPQVGC